MCLVLQCYSPQTVLIQAKNCFKRRWVPRESLHVLKNQPKWYFLDVILLTIQGICEWVEHRPCPHFNHINYELWILAAQTAPENKADYRLLVLAAPRARYQNLKRSLINSCDQCTAALVHCCTAPCTPQPATTLESSSAAFLTEMRRHWSRQPFLNNHFYH